MNGMLILIGTQKPLKGGDELSSPKEVIKKILNTISELSDKISSLWKTNKKLLETILELKKASKTAQRQYPTFSLSPPSHYFLSSFFRVRPPFLLLLSSLLPPSTDLGETPRKPDQDRLEEPEILAAPFKEKPISISGQGEPAIIYPAWIKAELRNLTQDFPRPCWVHKKI